MERREMARDEYLQWQSENEIALEECTCPVCSSQDEKGEQATMTEERALLLWRLARRGLSPAFFGDDVPGSWSNAKLTGILQSVEGKPPTAKQTETFLRRWRARQVAS